MTEQETHPGRRADRGTSAERPGAIPPRGWWDVARRVMVQVREDLVPVLAAGVAFYAMLALFPALIAVVTVYGLVADPADVSSQLAPFVDQLPGGAGQLLEDQMTSVAGASSTGLGVGLVVGLAGALWAASSGMQGLIKAVNAAYDERETRGGLRVRGLALLLTLAAVVFAVVTLGLVAVLPIVLEQVGLASAAAIAIRVLRWPLLAVVVVAALAAIYRYAPDRDEPRWRWTSPGALAATLLWLAGSWLFSFYVSNFGSYNETYGSLGAVIVLMLWLYLTSFLAILGAEINAETEHQTVRDTTRGPPEPMGRRGAFVADDVADDPR